MKNQFFCLNIKSRHIIQNLVEIEILNWEIRDFLGICTLTRREAMSKNNFDIYLAYNITILLFPPLVINSKNTDNDATICDKSYLEVFLGGYCLLEHIKKSAHANICLKSYASFIDFYLLKSAILPSFVIYRGSLSRIYLSALV